MCQSRISILLFLVVFFQFDRFPFELAVPGFLAQNVIVSATRVPAFLHRQDRGDTVSVANAPFTVSEKTDSELALWKDPDMLALAKELFKYAAIAAIGAYLLFKVIMPLIRTMMTPPPKPAGVTLGGNVNIVSDDENEKPTAAVALEQKLGHARDLAQQDPKVVANIIKDWTSSNAS